MTKRLTALVDASRTRADIHVSMKKTFSHHVYKWDKIVITDEEAAKLQEIFDHKCDYCERYFKTNAAKQVCLRSCSKFLYVYTTTDQVFEVESIVDGFGFKSNQWYLVKWAGYDDPEWERGHLLEKDGCKDSIRVFWLSSGLSPRKQFYPNQTGVNRCEVCLKKYKRTQDLKAHKTRSGYWVLNRQKVRIV